MLSRSRANSASVSLLLGALAASVGFQRKVHAQEVATAPPTAAPTKTPWKCVNPDAPDADDGLVHRGSRTTICLTIGPGTNWAAGVDYLRYVFRPTADEYSVYKIPNSFNDLVLRQAGSKYDFLYPFVSIFVASDTALSFLRRYYDAEEGMIYPYLTAIVDVQQGKVTGIAFDNACIFCSPNQCRNNTYGFDGELALTDQPSSMGCAVPLEKCQVIHEVDGTQCDLQLYVVWTGTDDDGNVLSSSDSRFSNFEPKQLQKRVTDQLEKLPTWEEVKDKLDPLGIGDFFAGLTGSGEDIDSTEN